MDNELKEEENLEKDLNTGGQKTQDTDIAQRAAALGIPFLNEVVKIKDDVKDILTEDVARKNLMAPFERNGKVIKIAMVDPSSYDAVNVLRFIAQNSQIEFEIYLAEEKIVQELINKIGVGAEVAVEEALKALSSEGSDNADFISSESGFNESGESGGDTEVIQAAPVAKLLSVIIQHAVEGKASDIHIEPHDKGYRIRFRVDGVLHASLEIPKGVGRAVVSRIKILSNLKIDEKRKPQDGRFKIVQDGHGVDFRVSTLPVVSGEKVVLRLLDKGSGVTSIKDMGLFGKSSEVMLKNIREPYGIILITGPTGSGKSTTLYSCLEILNQEERNIITLEDPVEYSIAGINQSQINPEIGYSFASGLRSILRQDPNVIMVGEIRDGETAELTIHAALTGHLVLSTLHTNSSIGAIPRLIDMGIEPFLLSSSLRIVAAQRLVRKICPECKKEATIPKSILAFITQEVNKIDPEELKKYEVDPTKEFHFYEGKGCDACGKTGYKGRIAVFEALEIDSEVKEIIAEKNGSEQDILKYAEKSGMVTIKQDGILKVLKGITTFSEVERVTEGSMSIGGEVDDDRG